MNVEKILRVSEPITLVLSFMSLIGIFFTVQGESGFYLIYSNTMFIITLFIFPGLMVFFGRLILQRATPRNIPPLLYPLLFLYTFIPTSYVLVPYLFQGFTQGSAVEILFVIFEASVFIGGLAFFIYFFRKRMKGKIRRFDLKLFLHYLVGGMVYFYFIRLSIVTTLLIQIAFETIN
jgi:hypothetical protein